MPDMRTPRLYPVAFFPATIDLMTHTYEADVRGGYRPVDPRHRGTISLNCPYADCTSPLVWDVSRAYLSISRFKCPHCHNRSSGHRDATGTIVESSPEMPQTRPVQRHH